MLNRPDVFRLQFAGNIQLGRRIAKGAVDEQAAVGEGHAAAVKYTLRGPSQMAVDGRTISNTQIPLGDMEVFFGNEI